MNRIENIFETLRAGGGKALMPFVTAGDPDLATTKALLRTIESAGARVCELGIPFSDPVADGPVIQASMTRALGGGVRTSEIFEMVSAVRDEISMGLVAMVSYSIVHRVGVGTFCKEAAEAGIDGLILPDLPLEEAMSPGGALSCAEASGLTCSFLIAPSTPIERAEKLARASSGFVYVVSRAGITGERSVLPAELPDRLRRLRAVTDLPIAVGFGISSAGQVRSVCEVADGAIVGSALVRRISETAERNGGDPAAVSAEVGAYVSELASGLSVARG